MAHNEKEAKVVKPAKEYEATYTVEELVQSANNLGTTKTVVRAALTQGKKESYTINEAKNLINKMKNKEVKA